ncbi:MAG: helix-turn-helix domain-containing protein [Candidatus Hodarchaeales archaeon]|jgi:transcriptional regulator with XRE-family HTH domain
MYLKNLVKIRKQKGWSQEKLAVESGISYNTIIKIERGGIENPKIETVIKLADALNISIDFLIGRTIQDNND